MEQAHVEDIASKTIDRVIDLNGRAPYTAARDAARGAGAPDRQKWFFGKGVNKARTEAGLLTTDWVEWQGKRYVFTTAGR